MTLVFTADDVIFDDVKNDVSLCKLDIKAKNQTAVAGDIGFFKLELTIEVL